MFTTCSHCQTRFRLTADQLLAAQGQVRCGQCHEVFDAYENLEGADVAPEMPAAEPAADEMAEAPEVSLSAGDDAAPELDTPIAADDEPITSAPALKATRRPRDELPIDDLFAELLDETEPTPDGPPPSSAAPTGVVETVEEMTAISAEAAPNSFAHVDPLHPPPAPKRRRPVLGFLSWVAIVLLTLLLVLQWVDMNKLDLAHNPVIGTSLQALYADLGRPIVEPVAVSEWQVGELNVTTDPDNAGALSITGTLSNGAGFSQPWPLLRVVLTDRFGEALRSRDFKPADYLPGASADGQLAAGLSARFRLDIVDPGADAVGFSLTPCQDAAAGRVCAQPEHD